MRGLHLGILGEILEGILPGRGANKPLKRKVGKRRGAIGFKRLSGFQARYVSDRDVARPARMKGPSVGADENVDNERTDKRIQKQNKKLDLFTNRTNKNKSRTR